MKTSTHVPCTTGASILPLVAAILSCFAVHSALANSDTWTGGGAPDGNWENPANWGGTAPEPGDYLFFDTDSQVLSTNNFGTGTIFGNITFNSTAGEFMLSGNSIVLGDAGQNSSGVLYGGSITNFSPGPETNAIAVTLPDGYHHVINANGGQLYVSGTVTRNADATIDFATNGTAGGFVNVSGTGLATDGSSGGGILGGWALFGLGNNTGGWATIDGNGNIVPYTGYTSESGSFTSAVGGNFKETQNNSTAKITAESSSSFVDMNTLVCNPGTSHGETIEANTSSQPIRMGAFGAIMNLNGASESVNIGGGSSYSLTAGGSTANNPGELTLVQIGNNGGNLAINSVIENNGSGAVTVNEVGSVNYNENNTYSGGTHIHFGEAYLQSGASFGTGPVYVYPGARADWGGNNGATVNNNLYLSGMGFVSANQPGAIKGTYTGKFTGTITLLGNTWIDPNAGSQTCTFTGPFKGTGSLSIGGPTGSYVEGTAVFEASCNYSGDTIIDATANANGGAAIRIGAGDNNIMNNGGNLVISGGPSSANGNAIFDLNGTTQTINGLVDTNTADGDVPEYGYVESSAVGGALVVGNNNASSIYYGNVVNGTGTLGLTKIGTGTIALNYQNLYTGPTVVSNGTLYVGGYSLASAQITVVNPGVLDVSAFGTYGLGSGQTLAGNGAVNGNVSAASDSSISPGLGGPGTLIFSNNLALNAGSVSSFTLSSTTNGANSQIVAYGGIALNGGSIQISGSILQVGRYQLILYPAGMESGSAANLSLTYSGNQSVSLDDSIPGEIDLVVSSAFVTRLVWEGDNSQNIWDIDNTADWLNGATSSVFTNGCAVTFNDSGSMFPAVNIAGVAVEPSSLVVSNTSGVYTLGGSGSIAGGTSLIKQGAGALVLADTGGDDFTGGILVQGGSLTFSNVNMNILGGLTVTNSSVTMANQNGAMSGNLLVQSGGTVLLDQSGSTFTGSTIISNNATVQLGNNDGNGALPTNSVLVNGTLTFNQQTANIIPCVISGSGTLNVNMTNNDLLLSGANTFSGNISIQGGTLSAWTASSLGTTQGVIAVTNVPMGATLDHGWDTTKAIVASGAGVGGMGAVVDNSGGNAIYDGSGGMTASMTLVGDTTFGGNTRWDLGSPAILSTEGNNYNLTVTSSNAVYFEWDNVVIDTNLGNIDVYGSGTTLGIKGCGESIGNPTNTITVHVGAGLDFWGETTNNGGYAKNIYVQTNATVQLRQTVTPFGANIALDAGGGLGIFDNNAQKNLTGGITLNGLAHFQVGDTNQTISGIISGQGGFYLDNYNNTLVLTATNTYSGETLVQNDSVTLALSGNGSISESTPIIIAAGALSVTNRVDGTLTLDGGQTLEGGGMIKGSLTANAGSTVSPGTNLNTGILTVSSNATLDGSVLLKLNDPTNDVLSVGGALIYGGTLTVSNASGATLVLGDSYELFNASAYSGTFAATNLPALGSGLAWNWNPTAGVLSVVQSVNLNPTNITASVSGNMLTLSWPADHTGWRLQVQTNSLLSGLNPASSAWSTFPGSTSVNSETITVDPAQGTVFYRMVYP